MRTKHLITGALWGGIYLALSLAPLVFVMLSSTKPTRAFWTELSVGLGFVGLAMMCLQFALTARFPWLKAPYGSDVVYAFHRAISVVSVVLVLLHPLLLFASRWEQMKQRPFTHPWPFWLGTASVLALLVLIVISVRRKQLGISYDAWRRGHAVLAMLAVALAVAHVLLVGHYLAEAWQRALWLLYTGAFVLLIAYVRIIKPMLELRRPWRVRRVQPQRGGAVSLTLEPVGHAGLTFSPGQFAWITLWDSPFSDREHPFSFSGSAVNPDGSVEFTIKELGDWTRRVRTAQPGQAAYVDGPFGVLSADRHADAQGFALFAGGIGITPMLSHIRTFADRGDTRPLWLFYGAKDWNDLTYREELVLLARSMPTLRIVFVVSQMPNEAERAQLPASVHVATGMLTRELIDTHAPEIAAWTRAGKRLECFICGPTLMMCAVEAHLASLGVGLGDYHAERFNLV
jgi:predicted ferric reductase